MATSRKPIIVVLSVAAAMMLLFIFARSLQGSGDSWAESSAVIALFDPILRLVYKVASKLMTLSGHVMPLVYEVFVRKLAHFTEYSLFGAAVAGLTVAVTGKVVSPYLWTDLFVVLMAAVLDEFMQSFVGRTSIVSDVLLDFSGAVTGIVVVLVVVLIVTERSKQRA